MDDSNKLIREQFGAHAAAYATSPIHAQGASLARLLELTQPQRDWLVLDVSTGAGHTALTFAPHVARVIAADLTPEMLEVARKAAKERESAKGRESANIEFRAADAHALPFDDNSFHLVTNRIALHHYADARQAIAEMARVCRPGGLVALDDNIVPPDKATAGYVNHFEQMRDPSHHWAYPLIRLEAYMNEVGLKVEHSESLSKEMEFDPWADRMGASAETKAKLRAWLTNAPDGAREFLLPRVDGDKMFFTLTEAIILGRKQE